MTADAVGQIDPRLITGSSTDVRVPRAAAAAGVTYPVTVNVPYALPPAGEITRAGRAGTAIVSLAVAMAFAVVLGLIPWGLAYLLARFR